MRRCTPALLGDAQSRAGPAKPAAFVSVSRLPVSACTLRRGQPAPRSARSRQLCRSPARKRIEECTRRTAKSDSTLRTRRSVEQAPLAAQRAASFVHRCCRAARGGGIRQRLFVREQAPVPVALAPPEQQVAHRGPAAARAAAAARAPRAAAAARVAAAAQAPPAAAAARAPRQRVAPQAAAARRRPCPALSTTRRATRRPPPASTATIASCRRRRLVRATSTRSSARPYGASPTTATGTTSTAGTCTGTRTARSTCIATRTARSIPTSGM